MVMGCTVFKVMLTTTLISSLTDFAVVHRIFVVAVKRNEDVLFLFGPLASMLAAWPFLAAFDCVDAPALSLLALMFRHSGHLWLLWMQQIAGSALSLP